MLQGRSTSRKKILENTEHLLLGAQPRNFDYWGQLFVKFAAEFHIEGRPNANGSLAEGGNVYSSMVKSGDFCDPSAPLYTKLFLDAGLDVVVYSSNLDPLLGTQA